jgi:hypothetical protein
MMVAYGGAVYWVYKTSSRASEPVARLVPLAMSLAIVPLVLVTLLATLSIIAKSGRYVARVRAARISPEIRETLSWVLAGEGDRERLRWLAQNHPRPFEMIFAEFLSSFEGHIKTALGVLAVEFGLAERWDRDTHSANFLTQKVALVNLGRIGSAIDPRLLHHPLEQTRIEAARAYLASGSTDAPRLVLEMLPHQSLLGRILLADSLRPFAPEICERYLADEIRSADMGRARASVDLLRAWERWIPITDFAGLIAGSDIDLRLAALSSLRFVVATEQEAAQQIIEALRLPDERVHIPAAKAAADLGIAASIPLLLNQLHIDSPVSASAAADALAGLGFEGRNVLENEILSGTRPQYALHALEQSLISERG